MKKIVLITVVTVVVLAALLLTTTPVSAKKGWSGCYEMAWNGEMWQPRHVVMVDGDYRICGIQVRVLLTGNNNREFEYNYRIKYGNNWLSRWFVVTWVNPQRVEIKQKCKGIFCPVRRVTVWYAPK